MSLLLLLAYIIKFIFVSIVMFFQLMYDRLSTIISAELSKDRYERENESRDD